MSYMKLQLQWQTVNSSRCKTRIWTVMPSVISLKKIIGSKPDLVVGFYMRTFLKCQFLHDVSSALPRWQLNRCVLGAVQVITLGSAALIISSQ